MRLTDQVALTAPCAPQNRLARAPLPGESGVYAAGPIYLSVGEDLGQLPPRRRPRGSEAIATVLGGRAATLRVLPSPGVRMTLVFAPQGGPGHPSPVLADGRATVRFSLCGTGTERFYGGVLFAGQGCARLAAEAGTTAQTMVIPIAGSLRGCAHGRAPAPLGPSWTPFLGVACGTPNRMTCDRIGIGVWAGGPAAAVIVRIAGRLVTLSPPAPGDRGRLWQGYLLGQGPAHGALRVRTDRRRRWFGSPELHPRVQVTAILPNGQRATGSPMRVLLHPGFG
ncbi:MAG: hypothetical protein ABI355_19165 [Solirubrobacteraceae bacterium]